MNTDNKSGSDCEIIIYVRQSDNEPGYAYDIYTSTEDFESGESVDGGLCTGDRADALEMAYIQSLGI